MEFNFNVTGSDRKRLVGTIANLVGATPKYLGMPTMAYEIAGYTVDAKGTLKTCADLEIDRLLVKGLLVGLKKAGFVCDNEPDFAEEKPVEEPEDALEAEEEGVENLAVSMPRNYLDDAAFSNLRRMLSAKGALIKKALNTDELIVETSEEEILFPWFHGNPTLTPEQVHAYSVFIQKICEMAVKQTRTSSLEKEIVNEKYAFRCFLLRLGMIGDEYKEDRKILLANLSGCSSFKNGRKEDME